MSGIDGITRHEPGALTLVARAGTPVSEVEQVLFAAGQRLAFEPMDHRTLLGTEGAPTIGAVFAMNNSGPRRITTGAARDFALGVRFVDGGGTLIRNGGRVMKNVTGYDLVRLMTGAHGTLGVLTEISMKVLPRPETSATLIVHDLAPEAAVSVMSRALGSPFEVSGAAHLPTPTGAETLLRVEGFDASVRYRLDRLRDLLGGAGEVSDIFDPNVSDQRWTAIADVTGLADVAGDVWRLSVKPGDAPDILSRFPDNATWQMDWGGGLIWAAVDAGTDLRALISPFAGHATLIRGSGATRSRLPVFHPEPAGLARLTAGLRAKFDPRGILNPGLMGAA